MKIPIRVISIATSVFWIFLIIFAVSAMYSMKDIQFNLGQPQISPIDNSQLLLSFPMYIANTGFYDMADFNISTKVFNANGSQVADGSTAIPILTPGQAVNRSHDMTLNLASLLNANKDLLFNDSELEVNETVNMRAAQVVPVQASSYLSLPWGAPLFDLAFGTPQYSMYNTTHLRVNIPISFENHAFFDLEGTVEVGMFNDAGVSLAKGQTGIDVPQHSPYRGNLELYVPSRTVSRVRFEVFFITQFFKYGPMVIEYGR